jgi:hypothetical protein
VTDAPAVALVEVIADLRADHESRDSSVAQPISNT